MTGETEWEDGELENRWRVDGEHFVRYSLLTDDTVSHFLSEEIDLNLDVNHDFISSMLGYIISYINGTSHEHLSQIPLSTMCTQDLMNILNSKAHKIR